MKKFIISGIAILLFLGMVPTPNIFAQGKADKYLGKRSTCLGISKIQETKILDDQTILFKSDMNKIYINRLPKQCSGLKIADAFSYGTSLSRLCSVDMIRVLENDSSATSTCGLGEFILLNGVKSINDAVKLLVDDGVLADLVKENAFETAFPAE